MYCVHWNWTVSAILFCWPSSNNPPSLFFKYSRNLKYKDELKKTMRSLCKISSYFVKVSSYCNKEAVQALVNVSTLQQTRLRLSVQPIKIIIALGIVLANHYTVKSMLSRRPRNYIPIDSQATEQIWNIGSTSFIRSKRVLKQSHLLCCPVQPPQL